MSQSSTKVLLAGIAGLAAGVAIGLLFAPAKGSKTRKRLKKRLISLVDINEEEEEEEEDNVQTAGEPVKPDSRNT